jgi:hypothetical protein
MSQGDVGGAAIIQFPGARRERGEPSIEAVMALAPSRSLVKSLMAEVGLVERDVTRGIEREFTYLAEAMGIGGGSDDATFRLRSLVDAQVFHAMELCEAFQAAADRLMRLEVVVARSAQTSSTVLRGLAAARGEFSNRAIAARTAADAALGAVEALVGHVRQAAGLSSIGGRGSEQLQLFAMAI